MDFSENWQRLKQELDSEKEKKLTEDGFTVVTSKKKKFKRKHETNVQEEITVEKRTRIEPNPETSEKYVEIRAKITTKKVAKDEEKSEKSDTPEVTRILGLDCEYVGVGFEGKTDSLARVSVVNVDGKCVYDKYILQTEAVTDYRTEVSGIRPGHLKRGEPFTKIQHEIHKLLADRIVVGHAVHNDFRVLNLTHPRKLTRDTAKYKPLRDLAKSHRMPSLKRLAKEILGIQIQQGEHDSITDARVALRLYLMHKKKWDNDMQKYR